MDAAMDAAGPRHGSTGDVPERSDHPGSCGLDGTQPPSQTLVEQSFPDACQTRRAPDPSGPQALSSSSLALVVEAHDRPCVKGLTDDTRPV